MVLGALWGDEGKGRVIQALASDYDAVCRFNGGPNAAHTVIIGSDRFHMQQVPCGIFTPGVLCCTGDGMVINLEHLVGELEDLQAAGIDVSRFRLSPSAHVVLPIHLFIEKRRALALGRDNVGSTQQGIGPAFADKVMRIGVRVQDLFDVKTLQRKLEFLLEDKRPLFTSASTEGRDLVLDEGHSVTRLPSLQQTLQDLRRCADFLAPYVADTRALLQDCLTAGGHILVEGAQGALLDIDHGTYPYVTASHPTTGGALATLGLPPSSLKEIYGVARCYATRQDRGTFPTAVPVEQEQAFRKATRDWTIRVGWLDLVALRYACSINGFTSLILTRLDSVASLERIKLCVAYEIDGKPMTGARANPSYATASNCVYEELEGWDPELDKVECYNNLPEPAKLFVKRIETLVGLPVAAVSKSRSGPLLWQQTSENRL